MLPRLSAEEAIAGANRVALGSGTMAKSDARRLSSRLSALATGAPLVRRGDPKTGLPFGIKVQTVPTVGKAAPA